MKGNPYRKDGQVLKRHHDHLNGHHAARRTKNLTRFVIAATACCLITHPAFAQGTGNIQSFADSIKEFVTGTFAKSVAIIAIAVTGYRFFTGRASAGPLIAVVGGCFLIFGASWFLDQIVGGG
jgi:type IV secretory pathway VirB2 component (pilin)